jgi:hypothetical protein
MHRTAFDHQPYFVRIAAAMPLRQGIVESEGTPLKPQSLYLAERLGAGALKNIGY